MVWIVIKIMSGLRICKVILQFISLSNHMNSEAKEELGKSKKISQ